MCGANWSSWWYKPPALEAQCVLWPKWRIPRWWNMSIVPWLNLFLLTSALRSPPRQSQTCMRGLLKRRKLLTASLWWSDPTVMLPLLHKLPRWMLTMLIMPPLVCPLQHLLKVDPALHRKPHGKQLATIQMQITSPSPHRAGWAGLLPLRSPSFSNAITCILGPGANCSLTQTNPVSILMVHRYKNWGKL